MNLPYMLKNWAKISGLSEDGETKSSEVEKVILCAYNSLLHSFCRSPQTHLVFGDHWRGTWSLLSPLVSTPCAWLNCHLLFHPFSSLSNSFPFDRLTVLGLYLELSVLFTGYIFPILSIFTVVPGLAADPSTSFEHKPPQLGERHLKSIFWSIHHHCRGSCLSLALYHSLSVVFKPPSIEFNRGLCLSPACRGVKLLSWR